MPDSTGGGISPDAAFQAIQGQLTQISSQQSSMGAEIGQIRSDVVEAVGHSKGNAAAIKDLKDDIEEISDTLHGNGDVGLVVRMSKAEDKIKSVADSCPHVVSSGGSTQALPAVGNGWRVVKWNAIKDMSNKGYKIAIVLLLLFMGYKELAKAFLGVPPAPAPSSEQATPAEEKVSALE